MRWINRLAAYPGLSPQPAPNEPGFQQLVEEITFAMADSGDDPRAIVKMMVGRGFWPLGTTMTLEYAVKFPELPA